MMLYSCTYMATVGVKGLRAARRENDRYALIVHGV